MHASRFPCLFGALALSLAVAACTGGGDDDDDAATSPTPACTPVGSTLTELQSAVFTPSCALASCHGPTNPQPPQQGMSLNSTAATHANTVGVTAFQTFNGNSVLLVDTAGGASASYLYLKVTGATGIQGSIMPPTGQPLCQEKIDAIAAWINAGAPNN